MINRNWPQLILKGLFLPETNMEIRFEGTLKENEQLIALQRVIDIFIEAGKKGGYPLPNVFPIKSEIILRKTCVISSQAYSCSIKLRNITINSFQLLRHMTSRLKRKNIIIHRIILETENSERNSLKYLPDINEKNEQESYPRISSKIDVQIQSEDIPSSWIRRCLVELYEPVNLNHLTVIRPAVNAWFDLLEAGAFAMPDSFPEESDSITDSINQFDEVSLEIVVDRFESSECAWNILINLIAACKADTLPVKQIIIE